MNWIKENKFLTGFLAVLLVGAGALGFFLFTSQGNFTEVSDNYYKQAEELKRLQNLVPYPDEANLKLMRDQKDEYIANIGKLEQELSTLQFPLEPVQPAGFQDLLKKTVDDIVAKAGNVVLPQKFYLGFDVYQTKPPGGEAVATQLARELKAIELVVNTLIDSKVTAITDIKRPPIPEEADSKAAPQKKLVLKTPFEVTFLAEQGRVRKALNEIVNSRKQFYIIRSLTVKNEKEKGPAHGESAATTPAPAATETPAPGEEPQRLKIIVGTEKLIVTARIEIVDFAPPATK
jgi:hypothetical protein